MPSFSFQPSKHNPAIIVIRVMAEVYSLVCANTGSLERLGTQLLQLIGNQVDAERELVNVRTLSAEIEDTDLWVWDTTVESGLRIRL
jgi:hypothetical protein